MKSRVSSAVIGPRSLAEAHAGGAAGAGGSAARRADLAAKNAKAACVAILTDVPFRRETGFETITLRFFYPYVAILLR
jgi:hypothetical protein